MRKKINAKFMLISTIAVTVTGICAMFLFYNILLTQIYDDLSTNARVILAMNPALVQEEMPEDVSASGLRITITDADGTVEYDSFGNEMKWKITEIVRRLNRPRQLEQDGRCVSRQLRVSILFTMRF